MFNKLNFVKSNTVYQVLISVLISAIAGIVMALIGVNLIKKGKFEHLTENMGKKLNLRISGKKKS